ncbi:MAG: nucleoside recognition protein [Lachnospiraceae bacterium]|nr:nucleoside recognition protein [Lachnospiraceae bacterium]
MLNYLWSFMILVGMLWGAVNGNLDQVTQGLVDSAKDAVTLGITMLGIMSFWCGILETGSRAGLIDWLTGKLGPVLDYLFPGLGKEHPARKPIAVNIVANMLGLGMAATPAGLEAMQKMAERSSDGRSGGAATDEMCTFLILNISSLQLIPVTMVAYRSQYGSADPTAVLGPALIATSCSTLAAVLFCRLIYRGRRFRGK